MNVIPERIKIEGTFRIMDEQWRYKAHNKIKNIAKSVAQGMGGTADIDIKIGFPSVYNNPEITEIAQNAAQEFIHKENVHNLDIRMTAEDFGWFAQKFPACFYRLGVGFFDGTPSGGLHSPNFIANEESIETGMSLMAYIAVKALKE
jgi:metal-dependent amidase/aminoacylase/carboxypeptidase family protein